MAHMNELLEREPGFLSESAERRINKSAERVVTQLLMCDEFELTDPVQGTSDFATEFVNRGPRDARGRSLREFDMQRRLFRYPCSYLIYSAAFDQLPDQVRSRVADQLRAVLDGTDQSPQFAHLTPALRADILQILRDTKPTLSL
jgi:hypothetical protein